MAHLSDFIVAKDGQGSPSEGKIGEPLKKLLKGKRSRKREIVFIDTAERPACLKIFPVETFVSRVITLVVLWFWVWFQLAALDGEKKLSANAF